MRRDQGIRGMQARDIEEGGLNNDLYDGTNLCLIRIKAAQ
jgi:hypothetical protein